MIKISIDTEPEFETETKSKNYAENAGVVLEGIRKKDGECKSEDFKNYWSQLKYQIWNQQNGKCCFCEKRINEQESQLEHYRPKTMVKWKEAYEKGEEHKKGYWWLAYEWKNFLVSCPTCNRQKGNIFYLHDETKRAEPEVEIGEDGKLGEEIPLLVNPRFENPEEHLNYVYDSTSGQVFVTGKDRSDPYIGLSTSKTVDLNRDQVNEEKYKDNLPILRAKKLDDLKESWEDYVGAKKMLERLEHALPAATGDLVKDIQSQISVAKAFLDKCAKEIETTLRDPETEFVGMCHWYIGMQKDGNAFLET